MSGPRVLYLCSNGVREPLVESQVLAYLRALRPGLSHVRLVTLERRAIAGDERRRIAADLEDAGIAWTPLRSRPRLGPANLPYVVAAGTRLARRLHRAERFELTHARSFLPGQIGASLKDAAGVPLLFDMRGFWILEKRAKGSLRNRWLFERLNAAERRLYDRADHLVSLTRAGERQLREWGVRTGVSVIPCCVDVDRFTPTPRPTGPLRLISVGSMGPGYLPEAVFGIFRAALKLDPAARLDVVTRDDETRVRAMAGECAVPLDNVTIRPLPPAEVPAAIGQADIGLCMIAPSQAKIASSPTKLAEYLACGRPVIATRGCGDVEADIAHHEVGMTIDPAGRGEDAAAVAAVWRMLDSDADLSRRCRRVAEEEFSLSVGVSRYHAAYERVLSAGQAAAAPTDVPEPATV